MYTSRDMLMIAGVGVAIGFLIATRMAGSDNLVCGMIAVWVILGAMILTFRRTTMGSS